MRFLSLLPLVACAALAACGGQGGGVASPGSSPPVASASPLPAPAEFSPLAKTTVDDRALRVAYEGLDTAASVADALLATGVVKPGTPQALKIADGLDGARTWLNAASAAQRAGQATNYATAIEQASAALAGVRRGVAQIKGK